MTRDNDMIDPSEQLTPPKLERFARAISGGAGYSAAYKAHMAKAGTSLASIKGNAWRIVKRPEVKARIEYLISEINQKATEQEKELSLADIASLMGEVTSIMVETIAAAEVSCIASQADLQKLRDRLVVHLGRLGRSVDSSAMPEDETSISNLNIPFYCKCAVT